MRAYRHGLVIDVELLGNNRLHVHGYLSLASNQEMAFREAIDYVRRRLSLMSTQDMTLWQTIDYVHGNLLLVSNQDMTLW